MWHLSRVVGFGGLVAALAILGSTDALAQKKKNKDNTTDYPAATDADYKSIQKQKELSGKVVAVNTGTLTIRVDYPHYEPNPKYKPPKNANNAATQMNKINQTYVDLQNQYNKAASSNNPKQVAQAQQRIASDMAKLQQQYNQLSMQLAKAGANTDPNNQPFIVVTNTKDFDLEIQDNVVYRRQNLPFEYDDTGSVKTYTKEEKDALRGDDKSKPGYSAKAEDLVPGRKSSSTSRRPRKRTRTRTPTKTKTRTRRRNPKKCNGPPST